MTSLFSEEGFCILKKDEAFKKWSSKPTLAASGEVIEISSTLFNELSVNDIKVLIGYETLDSTDIGESITEEGSLVEVVVIDDDRPIVRLPSHNFEVNFESVIKLVDNN